MKAFTWMAISTLAAVSPGAAPDGPEMGAGMADELVVQAVRFYRGEHDGQRTMVRAFVQVPHERLQPTGQSMDDQASFTVAVEVKDARGVTLTNDAWPAQHIPAQLCRSGSYTVNMMEFQVLPGSYRLLVTVRDSISGRSMTAIAPIEGYASPPPVSDLVLSPSIRPAGDDSAPSGGEWRSGSVMVASAAQVHLTPLRSTIYYLLEAYTQEAATATLALEVIDSTGKSLLTKPARPVELGAGGGVLMGKLELEGLPEGSYDLRAIVGLPAGTVEQTAEFTMAGLQETVDREMARRSSVAGTDSGYFAGMPTDSLDVVAEPLSYIAERDELKPYDGLSPEAKRSFLTEFWQSRDPDPQTPRNELRELFYQSIAYANAQFGEPGRNARPGWKTPRGEIWARYGRPDEHVERIRSGRAPTYEVWRYTRDRDRYFIFADRTGMGHYILVTSNDLKFRGAPDWRDILTEDGVRDAGQILNVNFYEGFGEGMDEF
ncbi:MAG: GWxTD domain-containing protein [Gemmatimonadales bacterium]